MSFFFFLSSACNDLLELAVEVVLRPSFGLFVSSSSDEEWSLSAFLMAFLAVFLASFLAPFGLFVSSSSDEEWSISAFLVAFLAVFLASILADFDLFDSTSFSSSDEDWSLSAFLVAFLAVLGTFLACAGAPFLVLVVVFDVSFSSSDESLAFLVLVTFLVAFVGELAFFKTCSLALLSSFFKLAPFFTGDDLTFGFGLFLS